LVRVFIVSVISNYKFLYSGQANYKFA